MDKPTWLQLEKQERAYHLKGLLKRLIEVDKEETEQCKLKSKIPIVNNKFEVEQQVLQIINWEKEEND